MAVIERHVMADAIRHALAKQILDKSDTATIAEATLTVWQQLTDVIAPVIGQHGNEVLFNRAMHITSKDFPGLVTEVTPDGAQAFYTHFKQYYQLCDPNKAISVSETLLITFVELLIALIGGSLTYRLLKPVLLTGIPKASAT